MGVDFAFRTGCAPTERAELILFFYQYWAPKGATGTVAI